VILDIIQRHFHLLLLISDFLERVYVISLNLTTPLLTLIERHLQF
jgi:hypothetical protein